MKAIIEGKRYDTETAKCIGHWDNDAYEGDFNFISESLYLSKAGAFFLFCKGGANTMYAETWNNGRSSCMGERIRPLTADEAYEWAEENQQIDTIEKHFSHMVKEA